MDFLLNLKDKTTGIRLATSLKVMKILNPTIYKWVNDTIKNTHHIPRPFTENIKHKFQKQELTGVEIGFGFGLNAENLLNELNIKKLYCIDPYFVKNYSQGNRQITTYSDKTKSKFHKIANDKRVKMIPFTSKEAIQHITEPLDFVYVDGNHTHDYVINDLKMYYPLIKSGGYIGGHDYIFGQQGVISAVQEFALIINIPPEIRFPDFWFQKEKTKNENNQFGCVSR